MKAARASARLTCSAPVLLRLENNINNYRLILTNLQLSVSRAVTAKDGPSLEIKAGVSSPERASAPFVLGGCFIGFLPGSSSGSDLRELLLLWSEVVLR